MSSTIKKKDLIRISESTYYAVKDRLKQVEFLYDEIEAKGKGTLNTWFINDLSPKKDKQASPFFESSKTKKMSIKMVMSQEQDP